MLNPKPHPGIVIENRNALSRTRRYHRDGLLYYRTLLHRTQKIIQVIIIEIMVSEEVTCNPVLATGYQYLGLEKNEARFWNFSD